jgi:hypothetical protein
MAARIPPGGDNVPVALPDLPRKAGGGGEFPGPAHGAPSDEPWARHHPAPAIARSGGRPQNAERAFTGAPRAFGTAACPGMGDAAGRSLPASGRRERAASRKAPILRLANLLPSPYIRHVASRDALSPATARQERRIPTWNAAPEPSSVAPYRRGICAGTDAGAPNRIFRPSPLDKAPHENRESQRRSLMKRGCPP